MRLQSQSGVETGEGEHQAQTEECLAARLRQGDLDRYSRLVSALWLFRSLNIQIETALNLNCEQKPLRQSWSTASSVSDRHGRTSLSPRRDACLLGTVVFCR